MKLRSSFALMFSLACGAAGLWAQATAVSQISGTVHDVTGSAVPNAEVRVTQTETSLTRSARSGPDGAYTLPNLPVGPYKLDASAPGFSTYEQKGIVLQVNSNPVINPVLQVGAVTEQVSVTADATMAETLTNSISQVIDSQRVTQLPLNGRNPTQLILLSGAAASAPAPGDLNTSKNYQSQSVTISIAGGQINGVNYLMDGGDNNDAFTNVNLPLPFPDAIQEFSVQTNALPARYGLHPAGVVNVVTKSGSNGLHGDVFEFLRNGIFNARNFFAPRRDTLKRNQFGGVLGGPVRKDKLFFFTGYQGTRNRSDPATTISFVPNQAMLNGDFSAFLSSPCTNKPVTLAGPFVNNRISPSQFNPQALALAKYLPVSQDPCGKVQYGIPNNGEEDQVIGRIDYNQSEKNSIFGRYFFSDFHNDPVFDGNNALTTTKAGVAARSQSLTLGDNYSFSPNLISSFHATGTRLSITRGPASNLFSPSDVGINISDLVPNFITLNVNNGFSLGCGTCAPGHFNRAAWQAAEDIDWIHGSHQISFGVNWIHNQVNDVSNNLSNGTFTFNGSISGNSIADFLIGRPNDFTQSNPQREDERFNYAGLYVQDNWKATRRLSVNAGLRWEPYFPVHDAFGRGSHFEPGWFQQNLRSTVYTKAPAGVVFPGDAAYPGANSRQQLNQFAPRLGLVFDPKGDGRQTIRASYGILYDSPLLYNNIRFASEPPFGNAIDVPNPSGGLTNPYQSYPGGNPFPQSFPPPKDIAFPNAGVWVNLPLDLRPTYMQQWNLSLQRQLGANWLASVSYLGNKSTHVWTAREINPAVYLPGQSTLANTNQRRVLYLMDPVNGAAYSTIAQTDDGGNTHYHGMLASLQHRFSHGFTVLANYTLSHCYGDADFNNDLTGPIYQNPGNRNGDRGNCSFDRRHIFNASAVAMTPRFEARWVRAAISGWEVSGIFGAQSGLFWTPISGRDNSLTGVGLDRPNVVGDWRLSHPTFDLWFNPAAFQANAPGTYGNAGRTIIEGPGYWNLDTGLMRNIAVREAMHLEFRAEAFNVLNHANMANGGLHLNLTDAKFGAITTALDPRILQFAVKLIF